MPPLTGLRNFLGWFVLQRCRPAGAGEQVCHYRWSSKELAWTPKPAFNFVVHNLSPINKLLLAVLPLFMAGCVTTAMTSDQRAAADQQRAARRAADEQRHIAEREADEQRHETDERRHAEDDLRHKFARYSTAELKLMDTRYKDLRESSGRDVNVTLNPMARKIWGDSDTANVERVLEIERELLRRWKAGDADAYLPEFEPSAPPKRK
jgi:hypothetical protein